jgi:hypothetical protein
MHSWTRSPISSILVYQQYPQHVSREAHVTAAGARLRAQLPGALIWLFETPHVVFVLAATPDHVRCAEVVAALQDRRWLDDDFQVRVLRLIRFQRRLTGRSSGPLPEGWQITRRHHQRLSLMVRALDGHLADASYREIADALYGAEAVTRYAWKTSSIRGQTIRLVKDAIGMMRGGYRKLLRGD